MNMKWRECLCLRSPDAEESDNYWSPEPILSSSSVLRPSSKTYNTNLNVQDENLPCAPDNLRNKEVHFHGESETMISFSEMLSTATLPHTIASERQLKTPSRYSASTNPRLLNVNVSMVPYPHSPGLTPGYSTSSWLTFKNMHKVDSDSDTVERDSEDSEATQEFVIFTSNRERAIRKNSTAKKPSPIYLENLELKTLNVMLDPTKHIQCQRGQPLAVERVTDSSLTPFHSLRSSDFSSAKSNKNSLYSNESLATTNEDMWATFVPLTPEAGKHNSESSIVESFSEPSYQDLKMLESDCHDESQINEKSKPSKGSGVLVEEVYKMNCEAKNLQRILV